MDQEASDHKAGILLINMLCFLLQTCKIRKNVLLFFFL